MKRLIIAVLLPLAVLAAAAPAGPRRQNRYVLVLRDPAAVQRVPSRKALNTPAGRNAFARIDAAQSALKRELANRNFKVLGSVQALMNAVFVTAPADRVAELAALPGVKQVFPSRPIKMATSRSSPEAKAQRALSSLAAQGADGAGVKIGIIDTGIDQTHPGFQDASLTPPAGFPKGDTAYTNGKVIVARSYVPLVGAGFTTDVNGNPQDPAVDSRPDDLSARDRVGHGTAVAMIAAGVQNTAPNGSVITGVAPKAYLGNYKIYGSPGVNDYTFEDVMYTALNDAYLDGMDVVTVFIGALSAFYGPLDKGLDVCNDATACDLWAMDADAYGQNMVVVISAGDDGDLGVKTPTLNTINSPGTAPSAITVGAITTAQDWVSTVSLTGSGAPSNLAAIPARVGNGPVPAGQLTGVLRDVAALEADRSGHGCSAIPAGSLTGAIALIQRGGQCGFGTKVSNASGAGAVGVVFYQVPEKDYIIVPTGLTGSAIPAVMVSYTNGKALKDYTAAHPNPPVTIDPALRSVPAQADTVAPFSSRGPSIADTKTPEGIKPEIAAPGVGVYTATQKYDTNSDMYSAGGYTAVQGTTFSTGFVAGAAALALQRNPNLLPSQVKSAVVNTADANVVLDGGIPARVTAVGAGKLNPNAVTQTTVTVEPATISFGQVTGTTLPTSRALKITNIGSSSVHLTLDVAQRADTPDSRGQVKVSTATVDLASGANTTVTVQLGGSLPAAGSYEGVINVRGGAVPLLRVPYLYTVASNTAYNAFPIAGFDYVGLPNALVPGNFLAFKLIDQNGVPVYGYSSPGTPLPGLDVSFRPTLGGGHMWNVVGDARVDPATDVYGIAAGWAYNGPATGEQEFTAQVGGLTVAFGGLAITPPAVNAGGVVNAASFQVGSGLAPGSYVSIFGTNLANADRVFQTAYLPVSLGGVSVSFDVPNVNPGYPGRIYYVHPTQLNVQIPWELTGQTSAKMKVSIGNFSSSVNGLYSVPLAPASPGIFEIEGLAAVLDMDYKVVNATNPAKRGQYVQIYANGLGPVTNQPASGEPANAHPASLAQLSTTTLPVQVSICGKPAAAPYFAGLAPGFVGLYQVNALVPQDCATGSQPVVITVNGVASKSASMPVQ